MSDSNEKKNLPEDNNTINEENVTSAPTEQVKPTAEPKKKHKKKKKKTSGAAVSVPAEAANSTEPAESVETKETAAEAEPVSAADTIGAVETAAEPEHTETDNTVEASEPETEPAPVETAEAASSSSAGSKKKHKKKKKKQQNPTPAEPTEAEKTAESTENAEQPAEPENTAEPEPAVPAEEIEIPVVGNRCDNFTMPYLARLVIVLTVISAVIAGMLAVVNDLTKDKIADNERKAREAAVLSVFPEGDNCREYTTADGSTLYFAAAGDRMIGYCVNVSPAGYSGDIDMMVGIDADGTVSGIQIVSLSETPGVGTKVTGEGFLAQYLGHGRGETLTVGENVDGISGATFSSKGVTAGVNEALSVDFDLAAATAALGLVLDEDEPIETPETEDANSENGDDILMPETAGVVDDETDAPETIAPETLPPETTAPETLPPETIAPETTAPETLPPETIAPETSAPETEAPDISAPDAGVIEPETEEPETEAPETEAPETDTPDTSEVETDVAETGEVETDAAETGEIETDTPEITDPETGEPETIPSETGEPETEVPETEAPETKKSSNTSHVRPAGRK